MNKEELNNELRDKLVNMFNLIKPIVSDYFPLGYVDNVVEDVVMTLHRAGYGKVEDYKREIEELKQHKYVDTVDYYSDDLIIALKEVSRLQNVIREDRELFNERLEKLKQHTLKEFAEKVKHDMYMESIIQLKGDNSPDLHTEDMEKVINKLLKEYGVKE